MVSVLNLFKHEIHQSKMKLTLPHKDHTDFSLQKQPVNVVWGKIEIYSEKRTKKNVSFFNVRNLGIHNYHCAVKIDVLFLSMFLLGSGN